MIEKVMIFCKVYLVRVMKKCVQILLIYRSRKRNDRVSNEFSRLKCKVYLLSLIEIHLYSLTLF